MKTKRLVIKQKIMATLVVIVMLVMVFSTLEYKRILADSNVLVNVEVSAGTLSMSTVTAFNLSGITVGTATNSKNNLLVVNAIDYRGTGAGWTVAMYASNFNIVNRATGTNNLSNAVAYITPGTLGNYNSASHTGIAVGAAGALSASRTLFNAGSTYGMGAYYLGNSEYNLVYNGNAALLAGFYNSTSTVTIV